MAIFGRTMFKHFALCSILISFAAYGADTTFLAIDARSGIAVRSTGPNLDQRVSPCCSFNIVLSLVGYETGILKDAQQPAWTLNGSAAAEGLDGALSPRSWMTTSAVWYSKRLAKTIGQKTLQDYLIRFFYGNQDLWGGGGRDAFTMAHECSTLMIAPTEQVQFLQRLLTGSLSVSAHAVEMTKALLYDQTFPSGWLLYGKTGSGFHSHTSNKIAWYVGWIEKDAQQYPFALLMTGLSTFPTKAERQEAVKQFFREISICL